MIIVTGATGQLGHAIVEALVRRVSPNKVGVSVRDPQKADDLAKRGVRVRQGDFAKAETLTSAFEGATQLLLVSSNAAAHGGDTLQQHRDAIAAAKAAGARRILYTSHMAADAKSEFGPARDHAATEEMLRESGVKWTSLRDGFHAASALWMLGEGLKTGVVDTPADGKTAWAAHADLAEAAAAILADEGSFDGPTPALTGSELLDLADLAALASEIVGKPIRREPSRDESLEEKLKAAGVPEKIAKLTIGYYRASRAGEFAPTNPTLEKLIGRRPTPMRDVLAKMLAST